MNKLPYFFALIILLTSFNVPKAQAQWSPQAKGAVIGGLGGAAAGAIINKRNRAVGGVVGGVAGGAIGYGVGKHIDNKRKQRAAAAAQQRAVAAREAEYRRELALARNRQSTTTTRTTQTALVPANSLTASNAMVGNAMMPAAMPAASNAAFLPNTSYGDASHPYGTSEYRRKSW
ncbi:glycine zipper domain-containing protein [Hymenobacter sp. DH14]|uniref:Glycine zipper domain-containing protein n=1 Tax=Hymenobacter cyanobacteriorum TaxID=2926463 RepID=A0A9X1VDL3_9BACT|nr:glycine zipper domain-containing protein [Hymenobacter cyanobacteriorum]MCI1186167.1 glycine zipper domain-containing protein [Hymenobacter cyanobacteriorum]